MTTPRTKVTVDGRADGVTPVYRERLVAGPHTLVLDNVEAAIHGEKRIIVEPAETTKIIETLK